MYFIIIIKDLDEKQRLFDKKQQELISCSVDEEDAVKLTANNRVIKFVAACKKSHGGPFTAIEELTECVKNWNKSEKLLHTALDSEIRFRKYSFINVKTSCPLFKQRGLTVEQKVKNLTALIGSQMELKNLAEMQDLEDAIIAVSSTKENDVHGNEVQMESEPLTVEENTAKVRMKQKFINIV